MNPLRFWLSGLAVVLGLGIATSASANFAPEGWYTGEDGPRALEAAKERGLPIAVIYMDYDST